MTETQNNKKTKRRQDSNHKMSVRCCSFWSRIWKHWHFH